MSNSITRLQTNNTDLQGLIDKANNLPDAGSTEDLSAELAAQDALILQIEEALIGKAISDIFAVISVTYPTGSTCTCVDSNGIAVEIASNSDDGEYGYALFLVDEIGTYIVSCFDGADYDSSENKKSETVEITAEGQSVSVTLSYKLMLFDGDNGGDVTALTGGWSMVTDTDRASLTVAENSVTFCSQSASYVRKAGTVNAIDMSGHNYIYFDGINESGEDSENYSFMLLDTRSNTATPVALVSQPITRNTVSINVGDIEPRNALWVVISNKSVDAASILYSCWLE